MTNTSFKLRLGKLMKGLLDMRVFERRPGNDRELTIYWHDEHGEGIAHGSCLDESDGGLKIACWEPVPKGNVYVQLQPDRVIFGSVRHTTMKGCHHIIGVEFRKNPKAAASA